MSSRQNGLYEFGPFRLDAAQRLLTRNGEAVTLPPKTFDLLALLAENKGRVLSKRELMQALWPDVFVEEANLSFQISALRKALGDSMAWIETLPKHGYRFTAPVTLADNGEPLALLSEVPLAAARRRSVMPWAAVSAVMAIIAAIGWSFAWRATRTVDHPLIRLSVDLGPDAVIDSETSVAISPDGMRIVFPARGPGGKQQLATRLLSQATVTLLPETQNGREPFFSPDGQWIGFFAEAKLKKIPVQGGTSVTLCDAAFGGGATWGENGTIVGALLSLSGLWRVSAAGGQPQPLSRLGPVSSRISGPSGCQGAKPFSLRPTPGVLDLMMPPSRCYR
jgi:DNA-binding winged helix-turn-helix (wHTH) protein